MVECQVQYAVKNDPESFLNTFKTDLKSYAY